MITYKEKLIEVQDTIICDICKKVYELDRKNQSDYIIDDSFEIQEFHHIEFTGGYTSVFGDGSRVKCDICQYCLKEKLGQFLIIEESTF